MLGTTARFLDLSYMTYPHYRVANSVDILKIELGGSVR